MESKGNWWDKFHELWGLSKDGIYNKELWMKLQFDLETLEYDLKKLINMEDEGYLKKEVRHVINKHLHITDL